MVRDRNDWCISRQRRWGVPIPVLYCEECGEPIVNETTIEAIAEMFRKEGSDSWYLHTPDYFLPEGFACPKCGCHSFKQEQDILTYGLTRVQPILAFLKTAPGTFLAC